MKKAWFLIFLLLSLVACQEKTPVGQNGRDRIDIQESPLCQYFAGLYPEKEVIVWALKDLDNDGRDDLILVYRADREKNAMVVVLDTEGSYRLTNDVPAPVSNQVITFKDIDEKPPMEFIVQGMKGTNIGFAVYRIEKGELVDLFGEGMDGCCG